jgi:hypothetical protein
MSPSLHCPAHSSCPEGLPDASRLSPLLRCDNTALIPHGWALILGQPEGLGALGGLSGSVWWVINGGVFFSGKMARWALRLDAKLFQELGGLLVKILIVWGLARHKAQDVNALLSTPEVDQRDALKEKG